jgi:16S rRNA (cytosine1402-N4)-methyltransferase
MHELPHKRRPRYSGKYPRRFEEKYKEHQPERFSETFRKVLDSGRTPAGSHRPILVEEVLQVLAPQPGELSVDCTLGYGGHAQALLSKLLPAGRLIGLDQDPIQLPRTEARLRAVGFGPEVFSALQSNFAGLAQVLGRLGVGAADLVLADLGVSSMQLDDPKRGFSLKHDGPLDMRMNPNKGCAASKLLQAMTPNQLTELLAENADEPSAEILGRAIAGHSFTTTGDLVEKIRSTLPCLNRDDLELSIRRTFQALRIAVNDEFSALDSLLRQLPACLKPGGRVAILTFHSGEDRRVKKAFASGLQQGLYAEISREVIRPSPAERHANPRSAPAKLRWARAAMSPPR